MNQSLFTRHSTRCVRLRVSTGGVARQRWPITVGLPFAEGELAAQSPALVVRRPDGDALPTQCAVLATWNADQKWVKWLLIDFQADLGPDEQTFLLEFADASQAVAHRSPIRIDSADDLIRVNTGPLELELRPNTSDFFGAARVRSGSQWTDLLDPAQRPCLCLSDTGGEEYRSSWAPRPPRIEIEHAGPLRACICIRGTHASRSGRRAELCPYVLRLHLYAGRSDVRLFHTFVFDGDPEQVELAELGIRLPLALGDKGDVQHASGTVGDTPAWASIGASSRGGSALVVLRDAHRERPKDLRVRGGNTIEVDLWPRSAGPMSFRTPFREKAIFFKGTRDEAEFKRLVDERPTAPLNLKSLNIASEQDLIWVEQMIDKHARGRAASHNDTSIFNGLGAAKTHEMLLSFSADPIGREAAEQACRCVQEPAVAAADPQHVCASGALRHAYPAGDSAFAAVDRALDDMFYKVVVEPRELCQRYGFWMYGSLMCSHSAGPGYCYRYHKQRGDPLEVNRFVGPYNNESNDQIWCVWFNFVRTGGRQHFLLAESTSEQVADCAFIHSGRFAGLMHYHNAHLWSGDPSPSHTLTSGLMLHYYFTGNRRLLDVALEAADWAVRTQEPAGIISNRNGALHREFTGPLICLLEAYQATWDDRYGQLARRSLNWLLRTQPEPGMIPVSVFTRGPRGDEAHVQPADYPGQHVATVYPIYYDALRMFPSPLLRQTILAEADHLVWESRIHQYYTRDGVSRQVPKHPDVKVVRVGSGWYWANWPTPDLENAPIVCVAYDITGDAIYAAWAKYIVDEFFLDLAERVRHEALVSFTMVKVAQPIDALMRLVRQASEKDPAALAQAEQRWRAGRAERGKPVYDGPSDWLPRDAAHFDAGGHAMGLPVVTDIPASPQAWRSDQPVRSIGVISPED